LHTKFNGRLAAAACGSRLDALALTNLHGRLVVDGSRTHALLDLSCHRQESLLYVGSVLGGSLEEGDSKAVGKLLRHGVLHDLLVLHIALVADKQLVDALGGVSVNLLKPLLDVVEGVHVGHIVDHADAVGTTVVGRGDGTEPFLASSVPLREKRWSVS